ncbi:DUF397 domain-containing protein [Kutzneria buriramensis]|uniref:Uncharacterized protein DUF397 n=1 Tax=Kutzneria buriramensis TaxID=1045776 RepID=A0A3E0H1X2_9PSEU|nr:DUF397 domain-containing protein [Kutzneria buriramensis]REH37053.1 uncharacterized protein DUF397 [Kutzneria buriramensis]
MVEHRAAYIVEVDAEGLTWVKSSYSNSVGGNCVEQAVMADRIVVRCSRDRLGSRLSFPRAAWLTFLAETRRGC